jgi:hypothetical protein
MLLVSCLTIGPLLIKQEVMMYAGSDSPTRDYSLIPTAVREVYHLIEDDLTWIHGRWMMYRQLYGTNEARIQLLNESAPTFLGDLQVLWFEYVVLEICKITDPPSSRVQGSSVQNLVITQLRHRLVRSQHLDLAERLEELEREVVDSCGPLREVRNRRIAHSDLNTVLGLSETPIPGISRQSVEDALRSIREYVNAFRVYFLYSPMRFEDLAMIDDATSLIHNLKRASAYSDLESEDHAYGIRILQGRWREA